MHRRILLALATPLCLLLLSSSALAAAQTKRVYLMGSSLTDQVKYSALQGLAESRGHKHIWGNHGIPGAPIRIIWNAKDKERGRKPFQNAGKALKEYQWDAVTIEPRASYELDLEAAGQFIDYTLEHSPEVQFYVFAQWPRTRRGSFDRQWLEDSKDIQNNIRLGFESFLADLRAQYADIPRPPLMIPVGHAMHLLELKIQAGLVPHMTSIYDGYSDGSHQNHLGEYIVGCTFFATIYQESPIGLPTEPYGEIPADLAAVIQETVWEAVDAHPLSGVEAEGELRIITPWFPAAVENEPFSRELQAAFGSGEVRWSLAEGALPAGIGVDPQGLLTGTTAELGDFVFTLQAEDAAGATARRQLKLSCVGESVPVVPEQDITGIGVGEYIEVPLRVEGGNGDITWRLGGSWMLGDDGETWECRKRASRHLMVPGLGLSHNGVIAGAPAKQGTFKLLLIAADSDPNQPDIAERELLIEVGPPGDGVCLARPVEEAPEIDGIPDAAFGELTSRVTKAVSGQPSCTARFAALYDRHRIYIAVEVEDETIVTGAQQAWEDDGIELYVDKNCNREKEYNSDDSRMVCSLAGTVFTDNVEEKRVKGVFRKTETGYTAEFIISFNGRRKPNTVHGFDLGVNDNDGDGATGRIMWSGTADNETDTSGFGTLILQGGR